jgi:hypothetical protein
MKGWLFLAAYAAIALVVVWPRAYCALLEAVHVPGWTRIDNTDRVFCIVYATAGAIVWPVIALVRWLWPLLLRLEERR